jgi:hypothetical protein
LPERFLIMEISFIKKKNNSFILKCNRTDGSSTWKHSTSFFVYHDLMHFAVETTLGYSASFYGMLKNGIDITEFDLPGKKRTVKLTDESIFTEHLVNLFLVEAKDGYLNDFNSFLKDIFQKQALSIECKTLTDDQVLQIRKIFRQLTAKWQNLTEGNSLNLQFS